MSCPTCNHVYPDAARFCARCGTDVRASGEERSKRRGSYAAHPSEPIVSFDVVTSLMPLASSSAPQTYKTALALALAIPVIAALFGMIALAIACAAVAVPVVYVLYLYDVNEWEDQPVPVVIGAVALAGVLAAAFTLLWRDGLVGAVGLSTRGDGGVRMEHLLLVALLVPVVSEVLKQIGPLWLSTRARFDDLLDALTFGVTAGATFAAVETIVLNHHLLFGGSTQYDDANLPLWVALIVTTGFVKPIVYGAATGIALAGFSGRGEGYDGFKGGWLGGTLEAIAYNIAFQGGLYLSDLADGTTGDLLALVWGLLVAAVVVIRLRYVLHTALLEGAVEHAARGSTPKAASHDIGFCSECELPLLDQASFCIACGASVRAASKLTRAANTTPSNLQEARS
jgi:hypothetical protein